MIKPTANIQILLVIGVTKQDNDICACSFNLVFLSDYVLFIIELCTLEIEVSQSLANISNDIVSFHGYSDLTCVQLL